MPQVITIDGVTVKRPKTFTIERYNLTKPGRVANGKMTMDLIAKKRKFNFTYDVISGIELNKILGVIDTDKMFFPITYIENGVTKTATVYSGAIPSDLFRTDGPWYWQNVQFSLIEQ